MQVGLTWPPPATARPDTVIVVKLLLKTLMKKVGIGFVTTTWT
jgi:hypothetical protein